MRLSDLSALPVVAAELAWARLRIAGQASSELTAEVALSEVLAAPMAEQLPFEIARVAYLIPRVAARMPWRADCLVQALAARRWLARLGYSTDLSLGTRRDDNGRFEAHAWLTWEGLVVTGGDVSGYARLSRPDTI